MGLLIILFPRFVLGLFGFLILIVLIPALCYLGPLAKAYFEHKKAFTDFADPSEPYERPTKPTNNSGRTINSTDYEVIDD